MKLLVTGAFTQDEKDLEFFRELGFDVVFHQNERGPLEFDPSEIDAIVCNGLFLCHDIGLFPNLKTIQLTSAGLDRVPLDEIERREIKLYNARGVYSVPMAEYVLSEILSIYKAKSFYRERQAQKKWEKKRDLDELYGKTVCVVGAGNVGSEVAKRFKAFGCATVGVDAFISPRPYFDEIVSIDVLKETVKSADVVVSTLPLLDSTQKIFNKEFFACMKPTGVFVNISRGGVVDEVGLAEALRENLIRHAVLDVFEEEPLPTDSELWTLPNVTVTPHCCFISIANKRRLADLTKKNFTEYLKR